MMVEVRTLRCYAHGELTRVAGWLRWDHLGGVVTQSQSTLYWVEGAGKIRSSAR